MDMMKMFGKMKEMQAKLKEAQDKLEEITATGDAGGGMVKAVVNGKRKLISLDIDKEIINHDDSEMMRDLIIAAVNKAMEEVEGISQATMKQSTEGLLPNIPGLDLDSIMGK